MKKIGFIFAAVFVVSGAALADILTAPVGINNASPSRPLEIGSIATIVSSNPQLVLRDEISDSNGSGNSHGFASNRLIKRTGGIGDNSFDCFDTFADKAGASNSYDHTACYQSRPVLTNTGEIPNVYSYHSYPWAKGAIVGDVFHFFANGTAVSNGSTVANQFGFYCGVLAGASGRNDCLHSLSPVYIAAKFDVRGVSGELARFSTISSTSADRWITVGAQDLDSEGFRLGYNGSSGNGYFSCNYVTCKVEIRSANGVKISGMLTAPSGSQAVCFKDGVMFVSTSNVCP